MGVVRKTVKQAKGVTKVGAPFALRGHPRSGARVEILARNIVTQNTPDIQVSGVFVLAERTYGRYPV